MHVLNHPPAAHIELHLASGRDITLTGTTQEMSFQLAKLRTMTREQLLNASSSAPLFLDFGDVLLAPGIVVSVEFVPEHTHAEDGTMLFVESKT